MTAEPKDIYLEKLTSLENRYRSLMDDVAFSSINGDLGRIDAMLRELPELVKQARSRGYAFKNYLEGKANVLAQQWPPLRSSTAQSVENQSRELRYEANALGQRVAPLRSYRNEYELPSVESAVNNFESRVRAADMSLKGLYRPFHDNLAQAVEQVKGVLWTLDQVDAATFRLFPTEALVGAIRAQWMTSEKEGPKGILFLTDSRLLFEQKEEIATKKILFIATEKQKVQGLKWAVALGQIEFAQAAEKGGAFLGIGKKEIFELRFDHSADLAGALLRLDGDSETWNALMGRVKSGDIEGERAIAKSQAAAEALRAAPTKCPTCGATFTQPIMKGMTELRCDYCNAVVRL